LAGKKKKPTKASERKRKSLAETGWVKPTLLKRQKLEEGKVLTESVDEKRACATDAKPHAHEKGSEWTPAESARVDPCLGAAVGEREEWGFGLGIDPDRGQVST